MRLVFFTLLAAGAALDNPEPVQIDDSLFEELLDDTKVSEEDRIASVKQSAQRDFTEFDVNGDGQLDAQEITAKFGGYLNAIDLFFFFTNADKDISGTVDFSEYMNYVTFTGKQEAAKTAS